MNFFNRKVEKQESVTTPAGTFNCCVVYSDNMMKAMMVKQSMTSRVWYAEGVGMIKQESHNKASKSIGTTVLTAYSK